MLPLWLYQIPGLRQLQTKLNQVSSYIPPAPRATKTTSRRILLVHAHPNPTSFSAAIAQQVEISAQQAGHELRRISLYDDDAYAPNLTRREHTLQHATGQDLDQRELAPEVKRHIQLLQWCDTLVFVYPTWWMNTPAVLKGWIDRTLVHDLCWSLPTDTTKSLLGTTGLVPRLTHITHIVGISTYGAPQFIVDWGAGDNGRRMIAHAVRPILSPHATVAWLGLYGMDDTTIAQRTDFLQRVDEMVVEEL